MLCILKCSLIWQRQKRHSLITQKWQLFPRTWMWVLNMLFSGSVSEHHPRRKEGTVWLKRLMYERDWALKDKHLVLFSSFEKRRTLVICFRKGKQSPGLMCIQAQQGSRGFWVTWTQRLHNWTGLDWACGRGDWHGSDQLCVNSSCLQSLMAERSLC